MKTTIIKCDCCNAEIPPTLPGWATLFCYKEGKDNRTDRTVDFCPECYGRFIVDFCAAMAARMGVSNANSQESGPPLLHSSGLPAPGTSGVGGATIQSNEPER